MDRLTVLINDLKPKLVSESEWSGLELREMRNEVASLVIERNKIHSAAENAERKQRCVERAAESRGECVKLECDEVPQQKNVFCLEEAETRKLREELVNKCEQQWAEDKWAKEQVNDLRRELFIMNERNKDKREMAQ